MRVLAACILLVLAIGAAVASDDALCGLSPDDWCEAPEGDPCGRHRNEAACRADPACFAMPYRGESVVPCLWDPRGFAPNCPAVGCTSTPPDAE
jgi:hypothetical protein